MKIPKLLAAGAVTLLLASHSYAQTTTVYIGGANAFRKTLNRALLNITGQGTNNTLAVTSSGAVVYDSSTTFSAANFDRSSRVVVAGPVSGVTGLSVFKTQLQGSVAGIFQVDKGAKADFLSSNGTLGQSSTVDASVSGNTESQVVEIAVTDADQASTIYNSTVFVENKVSAVPFFFVATGNGVLGNGGAVATYGLTNQLSKVFLANGKLPLNQITGDPLTTGTAYLVGRDTDAGARVLTIAESGWGSSFLPKQFANTSGTISNFGGTVGSTAVTGFNPPGTGGYGPSSDLVAALRRLPSAGVVSGTNDVLIGYLDRANTVTALNTTLGGTEASTTHSAATVLPYNGVDGYTSDNATKLGRYSFWCYIYISYRNTLSGNKLILAKAAADKSKEAVYSNLAGIALDSSFQATRVTDGAPITR